MWLMRRGGRGWCSRGGTGGRLPGLCGTRAIFQPQHKGNRDQNQYRSYNRTFSHITSRNWVLKQSAVEAIAARLRSSSSIQAKVRTRGQETSTGSSISCEAADGPPGGVTRDERDSSEHMQQRFSRGDQNLIRPAASCPPLRKNREGTGHPFFDWSGEIKGLGHPREQE